MTTPKSISEALNAAADELQRLIDDRDAQIVNLRCQLAQNQKRSDFLDTLLQGNTLLVHLPDLLTRRLGRTITYDELVKTLRANGLLDPAGLPVQAHIDTHDLLELVTTLRDETSTTTSHLTVVTSQGIVTIVKLLMETNKQ